jgi:hypothetical protein
MASLLEAPPARTGKCSLTLSIDGRTYRLRPAPPLSRGSKIWRLTVAAGQSRAGLTYSVCSFSGHLDCTCPDATRNFAACKHMLALKALGLVARHAKPSGLLAWENLHPRRPRSQRIAAPLAAAPATPTPDPLAKARRRHQPAVAADPAPAVAAGFRTAVAEHVAHLGAGGVS